MHDLLRLWRRVEALPVAAGVDLQWRELLGEDLDLLEPYLVPEQALAESFPCPHPVHDNCPRRVVHNGPDDIVAVCGNASPQCEPIELSRRDIVVRRLRADRWLEAVATALREANVLGESDLRAPAGVVTIGELRRRGMRLPVVWIREASAAFEVLARAIRSTADGDGLVVVLPPGIREHTDRPLTDGVVLLAPPETDNGDLGLWRALDLLDPSYRQMRAREPMALFDDVVIEFAHVPGERHVVRINGHDFGGFQKSDLKFLRLLYLAAARHADDDVDEGCWLE